MDLIITFAKIPRASIKEVSKSNNQLLYDWIDKIICSPLQVDADTDVEFTKEHLSVLLTDLKVVNAENCDFYFTRWNDEYDDSYWLEIKELKEWAQKMLDGFDFETNKLMFSCSW